MISITVLTVQSYSLDFLDVAWEIADTTENPADYSFTVMRSESPAGPFEVVSQPLVDRYVYRDRTPDLHALWRIFYYQIRIRHTSTGDITLSPVSFLGVQPDRAALEMMRLQQVLLKVHIGTPVLIYKKRTSGPSCPNCFDPIRNRSTASDCVVCFNSKYRGGFLNPIPTFANFSPSNKVIQISAQWQAEPSSKTVDMTGYPLLHPGDMMVLPTNRRWRVQNIQERSKQGFTYRQIVQITEISRSEVIYKMPIDASLFPNREGELWPWPADFGQILIVPEEPPGR